MRQLFFYLILIVNIFHVTCSQNNEKIRIVQVPSSFQTILYANSEKNIMESVQFYLTFDIKNNTDEDISLSFPEYIYAGKLSRDLFKEWREAIPIYYNQKDRLESVFSSETIDTVGKIEKTAKKYTFITFNTLSKDSLIQSIFSSYLEKMRAENKDTLHIGTISELKQKNSPILKALEGDSIIISFNKRDVYFDPIAIQLK